MSDERLELGARRVHFTGASGAGTTTLGRALAATTGLEHFESDDFLWEPSTPPFQRIRPKAERVRLLREQLDSGEGWVLSGSVAGWGDPIIPRFQLVVWVVTPTELRLSRLRQRALERFGPEALAPGGNMHAAHVELLAWASRYDEAEPPIRSRRLHEAWLTRLPCAVARVDGTRSVARLVEEVQAACRRTR